MADLALAVENKFKVLDAEGNALAVSNVASSTLTAKGTLLAVKSQSHVVWGAPGQAQVQEYGCAITNVGAAPQQCTFSDTLSPYIAYKPGSFTVDGVVQTPTITPVVVDGKPTVMLIYNLGSVAAGGTANIQFQVLPAV